MIDLFRNWYRRHFSAPGTCELFLVLLGSFLMVYYLMWLVGPLVVALCLAYCLEWPVQALSHRWLHLGRAVSTTVVMLAFVGLSCLILILLVPQIVRQGAGFYNYMMDFSQGAVESYQGSVQRAQEGTGTLEDAKFSLSARDFDAIVAGVAIDAVEKLPEPIPSMVGKEAVESAVGNLRSEGIARFVMLLREQLMPSVVNAFAFMMYLVVVPIFTFLMLLNKHSLQQAVRTYVLPHNQILIGELWPKLNAQIEGYIRGKLIHVLVITIANTLAFRILGLNYSFLLGFGVGLSVIIPYVGAVLIGVPVVLVALLQFGLTYELLLVLGVYLIIQVLDGNVLTPLLFSKVLNLDAFTILAAVLIFGGLWGFWGVFFAIPLATLIKTLIMNWPSQGEAKPS